MGKTITIPGRFTFDYINNNSDIGNLTDNGDGTIDATDVDTTIVRNTLGEDNNNVGLLCTSNKINKWAYYKPGHLEYDTGTGELYMAEPSEYRLGDFLAYSHSIGIPDGNEGQTLPVYEPATSTTFTIIWDNKQTRWFEITTIDVNYLHFKVFQNGVYQKTEKTLQPGDRTKNVDITVDNIQNDATIDVEVWVGSDTTLHYLVRTLTNYVTYYEETDITVQMNVQGFDYYWIPNPNGSWGINSYSQNEAWISGQVEDSNQNLVDMTFAIYANVEHADGSETGFQDTGSTFSSSSIDYNSATFTVPQGFQEYGDTIHIELRIY